MLIAIFGATSQIAKDLVLSFSVEGAHELILFARRPEAVKLWLAKTGVLRKYHVADFSNFGQEKNFDAIINFVGVGNPAQTLAMGNSIFDITHQFDDMALNYVERNPRCRYFFLSSGAAYGSDFQRPVDKNSKAEIPINALRPQDWYAVTKLYAECRHRALSYLPIVDIRVFNYFSSTQDISARFLICDIVRAIKNDTVLQISPDYIVRDYLNPVDFHHLIHLLLHANISNAAIDCYSKAPIDKPNLLEAMQSQFGLRYEYTQVHTGPNATGSKPYYYSLNSLAAELGYKPSLSSLEGLIGEIKKII